MALLEISDTNRTLIEFKLHLLMLAHHDGFLYDNFYSEDLFLSPVQIDEYIETQTSHLNINEWVESNEYNLNDYFYEGNLTIEIACGKEPLL